MFRLSGGGDELQMEPWEVQVVGKRAILYHGSEKRGYEVLAQSGRKSATAFYSADGIVLRQKWKFENTINMTLIREEEEPDTGPKPGRNGRRLIPRGH